MGNKHSARAITYHLPLTRDSNIFLSGYIRDCIPTQYELLPSELIRMLFHYVQTHYVHSATFMLSRQACKTVIQSESDHHDLIFVKVKETNLTLRVCCQHLGYNAAVLATSLNQSADSLNETRCSKLGIYCHSSLDLPALNIRYVALYYHLVWEVQHQNRSSRGGIKLTARDTASKPHRICTQPLYHQLQGTSVEHDIESRLYIDILRISYIDHEKSSAADFDRTLGLNKLISHKWFIGKLDTRMDPYFSDRFENKCFYMKMDRVVLNAAENKWQYEVVLYVNYPGSISLEITSWIKSENGGDSDWFMSKRTSSGTFVFGDSVDLNFCVKYGTMQFHSNLTLFAQIKVLECKVLDA